MHSCLDQRAIILKKNGRRVQGGGDPPGSRVRGNERETGGEKDLSSIRKEGELPVGGINGDVF